MVKASFQKQVWRAGGLFVALLFLSFSVALAQDTTKGSRWSVLVQPYVMFPNIHGTVGLGELPEAKVSADPGDVFSHLQMGAMLYLEARHEAWAFSSDILYMNLQQDVQPGKVIKGGEATAKQFAWELAGLYKINNWFEAGAGLRLNSLKAGLEVELFGQEQNGLRSASSTKTWVDPVLITRFNTPTRGKFSGQLRTDFGGFGIGSKFTWQAQLDVSYRVSPLFVAGLGYRVISVNYDKGNGSERFLYDTRTFGPVIRLGFNL